MIGRDYFERHAETLLKLARSASDAQIAASLTQRAADLKALVEELSAATVRLAELDHALKGSSRLAAEPELERALVALAASA